MREESHLDDMRSAIRGDFARLAERRGDQELMRVSSTPAVSGGEMETRDDLPEPEHDERRSWFARFVSH